MPVESVRKISLFFGHVASNIGDLAINRGQIAQMRRAFPDARLHVVLLDAASSPRLANSLPSFGAPGEVDVSHFASDDAKALEYALSPGRILEECGAGDADLVALAAGEHLFQNADGANARNLFWRTLPAFAANAEGRRAIQFPATFGPFMDVPSRAFMRSFLKTVDRVAAREPRSAQAVAEILDAAAPPVLPDPAFFLDPGVAARLENGGAGRVVGLAMRSEAWGIRLGPARRRKGTAAFRANGYVTSVAWRFSVALARQVLDRPDDRIRLFVQTTADRELVESVAARLGTEYDPARIEIVRPVSIDDYLERLSSLDRLVGSRFHAIILGLVAGVPGFGVHFEQHGHKMPGLFDLTGQPENCVNLSRIPPERAADAAFAFAMADDHGVGRVQARLETLRAGALAAIAAEFDGPKPAPAGMDVMRPVLDLAQGLAAKTVRSDHSREIAAARDETRALANALAAARGDADGLAEALAASQAERTALGEKLAETDADNVALSAEKDRLGREAADLGAKRAAVERRMKDLRASTTFRLGKTLSDASRSPRLMLGLPAGMWRLYRRSRSRSDVVSDRTAETPVEAPPPSKPPIMDPQAATAAYEAGGTDAVVTEAERRHGPDGAAAARSLIVAGRALIKAGHPQAELPLMEAAVARERSVATLFALMWAVKRRDDFPRAAKCVDEVAVLAGPEPAPKVREKLDKLRRSAFYISSIFDDIPARGPRRIGFHPRRIAYVLHNCLPYSSGGYATRASGLARGVEAAGWNVHGIARPGFPLDIKPELTAEDVPEDTVVDGIGYAFIPEPRRHDLDKRNYMLAAADRLEKAFARAEPEFILAASAHLSALPALIAARRLGIPFFYEVRGFWEVTQKSRNPALEFGDGYRMNVMMETRTAEEAEHVFTLTGPMRDEMRARGVTTPITLVPNSCEPERFTPRGRDPDLARRLGIPDGVPVIGYIGTFVQYEGLENLVEACAILDGRGVDFRLLLVGNENTSGTDQGPIVTEILRIAHETGLDPKLVMTGRVPHDEVESYYSLIDIAPFPRKPQPVTEMVSPMKPLEALAMEKAVVVSSVRALTEMIAHDETGLVFYKGSVESLADTLARLIADPALRRRLGAAGRDWVVRERTWKAMARVVLDEMARHRDPGTADTPEGAPDPAPGPVPGDVKPETAVTEMDADASDSDVYGQVRAMFQDRDRALGKVLFSAHDWARTRIAFDILKPARTVMDIGIGQGQLVNLLCATRSVERVHGVDFRKATKLIEPGSGKFSFHQWDITAPFEAPPPQVDAVVAMEVLEHVAVEAFDAALRRIRSLSRGGSVLVTLPWRERAPLYHHDRPRGHQQSFDDAAIERLFAGNMIYSDYREKWYFVFLTEGEDRAPRKLPLAEFSAAAREALARSCGTRVAVLDEQGAR